MKKRLTGTVPLEVVRRLVNTRDAAKLYGKSDGTLRNWRSLKKGPDYYVTDSGECLYDPEDLLRYKASTIVQRVSGESHSGDELEHPGSSEPIKHSPRRSDH